MDSLNEKVRLLGFNLEESKFPYFTKDELVFLLEKNKYDVNAASYEGLIKKANDSNLKMEGLETPDNQKYFLRLAKRFRKNRSGIVKRVDE